MRRRGNRNRRDLDQREGLTKLFDVQNRRFAVVSCVNCGYLELYKGHPTGDAIDSFVGHALAVTGRREASLAAARASRPP